MNSRLTPMRAKIVTNIIVVTTYLPFTIRLRLFFIRKLGFDSEAEFYGLGVFLQTFSKHLFMKLYFFTTSLFTFYSSKISSYVPSISAWLFSPRGLLPKVLTLSACIILANSIAPVPSFFS